MVSTRSRGRTQQPEKNKQEEEEEEEEATTAAGGGNANRTKYEESRAQRIKENTERMKSLGIFDLYKNLKPPSSKPSSSLRNPRPHPHLLIILPGAPLDMPRVSYSENKPPKKEDSVKDVEIHIPDGEKPEIYTEEHEKLLGDSKAVWTLLVDGYDEDGQRIYDPVEGKTCHQCRQKTLGRHTECSKCEMVTGQFCGDCLYMRYGENVLEVNENRDWICPVCRGICNCSRCRREKGWQPTGAIYKKSSFQIRGALLIYTRREQAIMQVAVTKDPISADGSHSADDKVHEPSDTLSPSLLVGKSNEMEEDDWEIDNDEESRGDDNEEDDGDIDIEIASQ
ncbi:Cell division cycle-associated 7-like protein [Sesamum angolense]|uniref:Cell division cycle-associated 7-like protein n=1 Tax=Sesamum angolense TaxID=2727404 RepID=A0AAE1WJ12_9LAMI|nr:Cell division cycle-associated 7-like protein [Sesamum angolense]